jgi:hypothetical protein
MPRRAAAAPDAIDTSIDSVVDRLQRRRWALLVSPVFVIVGMIYYFRWGSAFHHHPSEWISPGDLWDTLRAATSLVQGHVGSIYSAQSGFFVPPAFLILLAPLGALRNQFGTTFVEIRNNGHLVAHPLSYQASGGGPYFTTSTATLGTKTLAVHPALFVVLALYVLVISCVALFACDALAERLGVSGIRRVALSITEAVLLWNVVVIWGHPQDAIAVALVVYAVIFALDDRYKRAGWLLGASLAFQPLTIVVFPIVLVLGGKSRALGTVVRGVVPTVALVIAPLVASFHATYRSIVVQLAFPDTAYNHRTPWTSLAPSLGGRGPKTSVGGGPLRIAVLALAAGLGWLALRWRQRPEMIVRAVAVALALPVLPRIGDDPVLRVAGVGGRSRGCRPGDVAAIRCRPCRGHCRHRPGPSTLRGLPVVVGRCRGPDRPPGDRLEAGAGPGAGVSLGNQVGAVAATGESREEFQLEEHELEEEAQGGPDRPQTHRPALTPGCSPGADYVSEPDSARYPSSAAGCLFTGWEN